MCITQVLPARNLKFYGVLVLVQWQSLCSKTLQKDLTVSGHSGWVRDTNSRRMAPSGNSLKKDESGFCLWAILFGTTEMLKDVSSSNVWPRVFPKPMIGHGVSRSLPLQPHWPLGSSSNTQAHSHLRTSALPIILFAWGNLAADTCMISAHMPPQWVSPKHLSDIAATRPILSPYHFLSLGEAHHHLTANGSSLYLFFYAPPQAPNQDIHSVTAGSFGFTTKSQGQGTP